MAADTGYCNQSFADLAFRLWNQQYICCCFVGRKQWVLSGQELEPKWLLRGKGFGLIYRGFMAFMWSRERVIAMCGALGSLADQVFGCVKVRVLLYRVLLYAGTRKIHCF